MATLSLCSAVINIQPHTNWVEYTWSRIMLRCYYSIERTLADHNGTDVGGNISRFYPNPGVLIGEWIGVGTSDIDYNICPIVIN